jgi:hypothetical protein
MRREMRQKHEVQCNEATMRLREVKFSQSDELASVLGCKIAQMRYKSTEIVLGKEKGVPRCKCKAEMEAQGRLQWLLPVNGMQPRCRECRNQQGW